jgi:hypothetical protein
MKQENSGSDRHFKHVLPITNDFVIFAAYDELNISEGDLERSIPEKKILMLKNIGLLE